MPHYLQLGTQQQIWLSLSENTTIDNANYLLVARHKASKQKVKIVLLSADDISPATSRLNCFNIVVSDHFANVPTGQFSFRVYEQVSDTNTDESMTGGKVESGEIDLQSATATSRFTARPSTPTYKVRQTT